MNKPKNPGWLLLTDPCSEGGEHNVEVLWEWDWRIDAYEMHGMVCKNCGEEIH